MSINNRMLDLNINQVFNLIKTIGKKRTVLIEGHMGSGKTSIGRMLAAELKRDGVTLAADEPIQQATSLAVVNLVETGHPDYAFYREGVADREISASGLDEAC